MKYHFLKQLIFVELFFCLITSFCYANAQDLNKPLVSAHSLLSEGKYDQAFVLFKQHAEKENELAQMTMGLFNKFAWGNVKKNNSQACLWFYKAAEKNIPQAQKEMGDCLKFNFLEKNKIKEFTKEKITPHYWYAKALESGLYDAGCDIGRLYLGSVWYEKDIQKALDWCLPAAERSAIAAQLTLGDIFSLNSPHQNIGSAEYWYLQAVKSNSGEAAYKLANLYYSVAKNMNDNTNFLGKALTMMEKSASLKYVLSYEKIASLYWHKLNQVPQEQASSVLAKSYVWAKTAYRVTPSNEKLSLLNIIENEMPIEWQESLDIQVENFLKD